jgi:hypothetical protein
MGELRTGSAKAVSRSREDREVSEGHGSLCCGIEFLPKGTEVKGSPYSLCWMRLSFFYDLNYCGQTVFQEIRPKSEKKAANADVYRLLGGITRESLQASLSEVI